MHIKYYSLTCLKGEQNSKTVIEENPTHVPQVEYQDYLNIKKKTY